MTAKEFAALTDEDKRTVLVSALMRWKTNTANVEARSTTHTWPIQYLDGKRGKATKESTRHICELRCKEGSYWAKIAWFHGDDKDGFTTYAIESMDVKSGESRAMGKRGESGQVGGLIDSKDSGSVSSNRLAYWLGDGNRPWPGEGVDLEANFPLHHLLKHQKAIRFDRLSKDSQTFQISLDVHMFEGRLVDHRIVWIDPAKGFMPVRMYRLWELRADDVNEPPMLATVTDTEISEWRQVGGLLWFPWHIVETTRGTRGGEEVVKGVAEVRETTVDEIKLGSVTDEDLEVQFAPGTYVEDRVRSVKYQVGKNGEHLPFGTRMIDQEKGRCDRESLIE